MSRGENPESQDGEDERALWHEGDVPAKYAKHTKRFNRRERMERSATGPEWG
jgi:hypothetical protein